MKRLHLATTAAVAVLLAAAIVTIAGFVGSPRPATNGGFAAPFAVFPAEVITGERFAVTGRLSNPIRRPVQLRRWSGQDWQVVQTERTSRKGDYRFEAVPAEDGDRYVVVAPPVERHGLRYAALRTPARTIEAQQQVVHSRPLPPIVQPGVYAERVSAADGVLEARFRPARAGRTVVLQQRSEGEWVDVQEGKQDRSGRVWFTTDPHHADGRPIAYRVVATRWRGAQRAPGEVVRADDWRLRFRDEFDGDELDERFWSHRLVGQYIPSRTVSASHPDAVELAEGTAQLMVLDGGVRDGKQHYLNAQFSTQDRFSFLHGIAAARIKFPPGQGQHGAFWLQPQHRELTPGNPELSGAEIDVIEYFGAGKGGGLASFIHYLDDSEEGVKVGGIIKNADRFLADADDDWWRRYHVFSVEWTPDEYVFRIDGQESFRTSRGVSGQPQYLILSLLTSDWELPRLDRSTLPTRMYVDWVQVWQQ